MYAMRSFSWSSPPTYQKWVYEDEKPDYFWEGAEKIRFRPYYRIHPKPDQPPTDNGWGIYLCKLLPDPRHDNESRRRMEWDIKVIGCVEPFDTAKVYEATGTWIFTKKQGKNGRNFDEWGVKVDGVVPGDAETLPEIMDFLQSIKHIGPSRARKLVEWAQRETGDQLQTLKAMEALGKTVLKEAGIGDSFVDEVWEDFTKKRDELSVMRLLNSCDIKGELQRAVLRMFGKHLQKAMLEAPERIQDVEDMPFPKAHRLWIACGLAKDDIRIVAAGMSHVLSGIANQGHCWSETRYVLRKAAELLGIHDLATRWFKEHYEQKPEIERLIYVDQYGNIWLQRLWHAERVFAQRLAELNTGKPILDTPERVALATSLLSEIRKGEGIRLDDNQAAAVIGILQHPVSILTGSAGTGKTTIVKAAIQLLQALNVTKIKLMAPTGKAARNATRKTNLLSTTMHSALEFLPTGSPGRNADNPIDAEFIGVDEVSMVDIVLAKHLVSATPINCALVFIGDENQLPAVGPGAVLRDLTAANVLPLYRLKKTYRQNSDSHLLDLFYAVLNRKPMKLWGTYGEQLYDDIECVDIVGENAEDYIKQWAIEKWYEIPDSDRLKFITYRKGKPMPAPGMPEDDKTTLDYRDAGVFGLSKTIVNTFFPEIIDGDNEVVWTHRKQVYREGFRCLWKRNLPKDDPMQLTNGQEFDIVKIWTADDTGDTMIKISTEDVYGNDVEYSFKAKDYEGDFVLGYALTIHSSQGSDYEEVAVFLRQGDQYVLDIPALYTALSRASKKLYIVGDLDVMWDIPEVRTNRQTQLTQKLLTTMGGKR